MSAILYVGILGCNAASAEQRVALVIGNGAYEKVPKLTNPANDAKAVGASLSRLGFRVTQLNDATATDMRKALISFGATAQDSDMAVIFYAGHGMEVGGENWLIPVDAALRSDTDTDQEAISLRGVMLQAGKAKKLGLVILDACRNNPFAAKMRRSNQTRAVTRGLASVEPSDNLLIAYASKDGTVANDGDGQHSPFTVALLHHIETPGLEISFVFRNVRDEVLASTKREQQPFVYGSLSKDAIYLKSLPLDLTVATRSPELTRPNTGTLAAWPAALPFTSDDSKRVSEIASQLNLIVPAYAFGEIKADVPASASRFVGVWTSKGGFGGKGRHLMIIVTDAMSDGSLLGYYMYGDATAASWIKSPHGYVRFSSKVSGNDFSFKSGLIPFEVRINDRSELIAKTYRMVDGRPTTQSSPALLKPTWLMFPPNPKVASPKK